MPLGVGFLGKNVVGIASLVYGLAILCSRLIGLVREAVIGRYLGVGREADIYWTAFVIPDFLNYLLAGGILSIAFIPIFQKRLSENSETAPLFLSNLLNSLGLLVIGFTVLLWTLTPKLTPWIAPGMNGDDLNRLNLLVRIILPAQIFHLTGAVLSAALQAQDKHTMPALAPIIYTLGIVMGGVILGPTLGAEGFAWGVLAGSFLGPFLCPFIGQYRQKLRWQMTLNLSDRDLRRYFVLSLPIMLGFSVIVLDDMIIKALASELSRAGSISELQYARTLMKVPMGIFGLAAGMATFPSLSRLFVADDQEKAFELLSKAIRMTVFLAFCAHVLLSAVGTEIATVIWGTDRFTSAALREIGDLTAFYALGLWAWSLQGLVARGFYAQQDTWTPTIMGTILFFAWIPIYHLSASTTRQLALCSSAVISVYVIALTAWLYRKAKLKGLNIAAPWRPILRLFMVTLLVNVIVQKMRQSISIDGPPLLVGALFGMTAITIFCIAAVVIGNREVKVIGTLLHQKLKKS